MGNVIGVCFGAREGKEGKEGKEAINESFLPAFGAPPREGERDNTKAEQVVPLPMLKDPKLCADVSWLRVQVRVVTSYATPSDQKDALAEKATAEAQAATQQAEKVAKEVSPP